MRISSCSEISVNPLKAQIHVPLGKDKIQIFEMRFFWPSSKFYVSKKPRVWCSLHQNQIITKYCLPLEIEWMPLSSSNTHLNSFSLSIIIVTTLQKKNCLFTFKLILTMWPYQSIFPLSVKLTSSYPSGRLLFFFW